MGMRLARRVIVRSLFYMAIPTTSMLAYALLAIILQHIATVCGIQLSFIWALGMAITIAVAPFTLWCAVEIHHAPLCPPEHTNGPTTPRATAVEHDDGDGADR